MKEELHREHNYLPYFTGIERALPALPRICGYENNVKPCYYDVHGLKRGDIPRFLFQYTVSGRGELTIGDNVFPLESGTAMLLEFPGDFYYRIHPDARSWELLFTSFQDPLSMVLLKNLKEKYGCVFELNENSDTIHSLRMIHRRMKNALSSGAYVLSRAGYDFLMSLANDLRQSETRSAPSDILSMAQRYCMENLRYDIGVSGLAEFCGYSRSHFSRVFHLLSGESPADFIVKFKMNMAAQILMNEPLGIKELAERCGFRDVSYFCRVFKKYFHLTPRQFRNKLPG